MIVFLFSKINMKHKDKEFANKFDTAKRFHTAVMITASKYNLTVQRALYLIFNTPDKLNVVQRELSETAKAFFVDIYNNGKDEDFKAFVGKKTNGKYFRFIKSDTTDMRKLDMEIGLAVDAAINTLSIDE